MNVILTGSCNGIDHATSRSSEFCRIRVRQNLEFQDRFHTKQHTSGRTRRLVVDIINVGAIEQKVVLLGPGAVNGNLRRAPANDVVARGQCGSDSRLKKRELLERPAVQRQIANLLIIHEAAYRRRSQVDWIGVRNDLDLIGDLSDIELHVHHGVLAHGQTDTPARHGLESG